MVAFLITMLVLHGLNILIDLVRLMKDDYPRVKQEYAGHDALSMFLSFLMSGWIIYLLSTA